MANKKITNVSALSAVISMVQDSPAQVMSDFTNEQLIEKLDAMRLSFKKKSGAIRKPTAQQKANEDLRIKIVEILSDGVLRDTSGIRCALGLPSDTTPQKITGIMRPAMLDGTIVGKTVKGKKFYTLAELDSEGDVE